MSRLPVLNPTTDHGFVYVVKRGLIYKIGFSRTNVRRRVRTCGGELILTIPTGQQPATLERIIHHRFNSKRTTGPGFTREWFTLDDADLDWLRGLPCFMAGTDQHLEADNKILRKAEGVLSPLD